MTIRCGQRLLFFVRLCTLLNAIIYESIAKLGTNKKKYTFTKGPVQILAQHTERDGVQHIVQNKAMGNMECEAQHT